VVTDLAGDDEFVDLYGRVGVERRETGSHLVQQYTERPPIHRLVVALHRNTPRRLTLHGRFTLTRNFIRANNSHE